MRHTAPVATLTLCSALCSSRSYIAIWQRFLGDKQARPTEDSAHNELRTGVGVDTKQEDCKLVFVLICHYQAGILVVAKAMLLVALGAPLLSYSSAAEATFHISMVMHEKKKGKALSLFEGPEGKYCIECSKIQASEVKSDVGKPCPQRRRPVSNPWMEPPKRGCPEHGDMIT